MNEISLKSHESYPLVTLNEDIVSSLQTAPLYHKQGSITVRIATTGERVKTVLGNSLTETTQTALGGEYIIRNPGWEEYLPDQGIFKKRYTPTENPNIWKARGSVRAISNPFAQRISIVAPWWETQSWASDCILALPCNQEGTPQGPPYLIGKSEFESTYSLAEY